MNEIVLPHGSKYLKIIAGSMPAKMKIPIRIFTLDKKTKWIDYSSKIDQHFKCKYSGVN